MVNPTNCSGNCAPVKRIWWVTGIAWTLVFSAIMSVLVTSSAAKTKADRNSALIQELLTKAVFNEFKEAETKRYESAADASRQRYQNLMAAISTMKGPQRGRDGIQN